MGQLVYLEDGYNLTANPNALPVTFMQTVTCSALYVEFLKTTTEDQPIQEKKKAANHAVFKIIFARPYDGFSGIRLEVAVDYKYKSTPGSISGQPVRFKPGYLCIKPNVSTRPSGKTASTCQLSIAPNFTIGQVIGVLLRYQMQHFDFVNINDRYFGCRDFVTQAIYLLHSQGFIRSDTIITVLSGPNLPVRSIYDALGLRFTSRGRIFTCPIDRGRFAVYRRCEWSQTPYQASQRALELAAYIPEE